MQTYGIANYIVIRVTSELSALGPEYRARLSRNVHVRVLFIHPAWVLKPQSNGALKTPRSCAQNPDGNAIFSAHEGRNVIHTGDAPLFEPIFSPQKCWWNKVNI